MLIPVARGGRPRFRSCSDDQWWGLGVSFPAFCGWSIGEEVSSERYISDWITTKTENLTGCLRFCGTTSRAMNENTEGEVKFGVPVDFEGPATEDGSSGSGESELESSGMLDDCLRV
jgi:hypothetical protein